MKQKPAILSFLSFIVASLWSNITSAQPMLQGRPSIENFIGSPGMWVVSAGTILIIVIAAILSKRKLATEAVNKKK